MARVQRPDHPASRPGSRPFLIRLPCFVPGSGSSTGAGRCWSARPRSTGSTSSSGPGRTRWGSPSAWSSRGPSSVDGAVVVRTDLHPDDELRPPGDGRRPGRPVLPADRRAPRTRPIREMAPVPARPTADPARRRPGGADRAPDRPPKILFVAEAVTLAHVARPLALAGSLDPAGYEVVLRRRPRVRASSGEPAGPGPADPIDPAPPSSWTPWRRAARSTTPRPWAATSPTTSTLIREVEPDAIVGDFRLSLSVSARLAGVPYLAITNAYWSPYARQRFPMPEFPIVAGSGSRWRGPLFAAARPARLRDARPADEPASGATTACPRSASTSAGSTPTPTGPSTPTSPSWPRPSASRRTTATSGRSSGRPTVEPPPWWGEIPRRPPGRLRDPGQLGPAACSRPRSRPWPICP